MQGPDVVVGSVTFGRAFRSAADARVVWLLPRGDETGQRQMHHPSFLSTPHTRGEPAAIYNIPVLCRSVHRVGAWEVGDGPYPAPAHTRRLEHETGVPRGLPEPKALQGHGLGDQVGGLPATNYRRIEPPSACRWSLVGNLEMANQDKRWGVLGNDTRTQHSCRWSGWQTPMRSIARFGSAVCKY